MDARQKALSGPFGFTEAAGMSDDAGRGRWGKKCLMRRSTCLQMKFILFCARRINCAS